MHSFVRLPHVLEKANFCITTDLPPSPTSGIKTIPDFLRFANSQIWALPPPPSQPLNMDLRLYNISSPLFRENPTKVPTEICKLIQSHPVLGRRLYQKKATVAFLPPEYRGITMLEYSRLRTDIRK